MSRRKRGTLVALAVLAALIATEVGLRVVKGPEAMVEVDNLGAEPIEGLVLSLGAGTAAVGRVEPGGTAKVFLNGHGPRTLKLAFRQRGNPATGFLIPGFDPETMQRDGFKLVLKVKPNELVRYQDDAEPATPMGRAVKDLWDRMLVSLGVGPDGYTQ